MRGLLGSSILQACSHLYACAAIGVGLPPMSWRPDTSTAAAHLPRLRDAVLPALASSPSLLPYHRRLPQQPSPLALTEAGAVPGPFLRRLPAGAGSSGRDAVLGAGLGPTTSRAGAEVPGQEGAAGLRPRDFWFVIEDSTYACAVSLLACVSSCCCSGWTSRASGSWAMGTTCCSTCCTTLYPSGTSPPTTRPYSRLGGPGRVPSSLRRR